MQRCARFALHIDSDVVVKRFNDALTDASWVQLAMEALEQQPNALSINPMRATYKGKADFPHCEVVEPHACICQRARADNRTWKAHSLRPKTPQYLSLRGHGACGFYLSGPQVFAGYTETFMHVSLQAFVVHLERWRELLPLRVDRPEHHIEKQIEQAGNRKGRLHMMYMTPQHLGVAKAVQSLRPQGRHRG